MRDNQGPTVISAAKPNDKQLTKSATQPLLFSRLLAMETILGIKGPDFVMVAADSTHARSIMVMKTGKYGARAD